MPPANDAFVNAVTLTGTSGVQQSIGGDSTDATTEANDPLTASYGTTKTVWYKVDPVAYPRTLALRNALNAGWLPTPTYSSLGLYEATALPVTQKVVENRSSFGYVNPGSWVLPAGKTFYVEIAGYSAFFDFSGVFTLAYTLTDFSVPANDDFANATVISGVTGSISGDNTGATLEVGEDIYNTGKPGSLQYGGGASVWYEWTCPASGDYTFSSSCNGVDSMYNGTILTVCTGAAVGALTIVGQNSIYYGGSVTFAATIGTVYHIAVDGYNGTAPNAGGYNSYETAFGPFDLFWSVRPGATVAGDNVHVSKSVYGTTEGYAKKSLYQSVSAFDVQCDVRWTDFTAREVIRFYEDCATFFMATGSGNRRFGFGIRENEFYDPGDPNAAPDGYVYAVEWYFSDSAVTQRGITYDHTESDQWHTVSCSYTSGGELVVTIDGDDYTVRAPGIAVGSANRLQWGQYTVTSSTTPGDFYMRNLTVGTSGVGSSEILDDDASMQGFVAWEEVFTSGTVTISRTGTDPSVATDGFENSLWRWDQVSSASTNSGFSCAGIDSLVAGGSSYVERYMGGTAGLVGLGDFDRWAYMAYSIYVDDWSFLSGSTDAPRFMIGSFNGSEIWTQDTSASTGELQWIDALPGQVAPLIQGQWNSVVYGVYHKSSDDSFDIRVIVNGVDYGVVNDPYSVDASPVDSVRMGELGGGGYGSYYDSFTFQMDTLLSAPVCSSVITITADLIDQTTMRLNARVNPDGVSSTGYFEYGLTGYDNTTTPQALGAGSSPVSIDEVITDLQPGTLYQFRAVRNP